MAVGMLRTCYVVSHRLNPEFQAEYSKNLSRRPGGEGSGQNGPQTSDARHFNSNVPNRIQGEEVVIYAMTS